MTKKKEIEEQVRKKYMVPGMAAYSKRSKNAIHISPSNTIRHEMTKCLLAYQLRKWGDVKLSKEITNLISELEKKTKELMKDFPKESVAFITEAVPKINIKRRVDLVALNPETWIEIETDKKVEKGDCVTFHI